MVVNYLAERRRLGSELHKTGLALASLARYVEALGHAGPLTVQVMVDWARRDSVNADAMRGQIVGHHLREVNDRALRCAIRRSPL